MTLDEIRATWEAQVNYYELFVQLAKDEGIDLAQPDDSTIDHTACTDSVVLPTPVGALARSKDGDRISFHQGCVDKEQLRTNLDDGLTGGPYRTEYVFTESQVRAALSAERLLRLKAQEELVSLKNNTVNAVRQAQLEEREACAKVAEDPFFGDPGELNYEIAAEIRTR